jgi:hypothetical protein
MGTYMRGDMLSWTRVRSMTGILEIEWETGIEM